jgi:site-specific DNA-methyltransferase (adenine-specific)
VAGDALEAIPKLVEKGVLVDSVVTDPPYHLTATVKRFGSNGSAPAQFGKDGAMKRLSKGFMGKTWDGGDMAFRPETWITISSIMRPGAFLVVFGGTRTCHRMACDIEDAGFVIQDCIMWLYGSGFPKRRDMLKPAYEPIVLAYKPGGKRTMQVDECRIAGETPSVERRAIAARSGKYGRRRESKGPFQANVDYDKGREFYLADHPGEELGRWPANICHDGSDEVVAAFPKTESHGGGTSSTGFWQYDGRRQPIADGDSGSATRFFYSSKAGPEDRNGSKHPTVKPVSLMRWLVPLVTPKNGIVLDPFAGTGTTGIAAKQTGRSAILIEREEEYITDIRNRFKRKVSNPPKLSSIPNSLWKEPVDAGAQSSRPQERVRLLPRHGQEKRHRTRLVRGVSGLV